VVEGASQLLSDQTYIKVFRIGNKKNKKIGKIVGDNKESRYKDAVKGTV
jgi:hypothetical protein